MVGFASIPNALLVASARETGKSYDHIPREILRVVYNFFSMSLHHSKNSFTVFITHRGSLHAFNNCVILTILRVEISFKCFLTTTDVYVSDKSFF